MLGQKLLQSMFKSSLIALGATIVLLTNIKASLAAEKVTFTYGLASQTVSLAELEAFAATGEVSPAIDFLLDFSGQNPEIVRWLLRQEFPTDTVIMSKLLNTLIGEYALTESSNIIHSRSPRGDMPALRGALIASSSDDRRVSLLELWRNYPTEEVYVDGKSLSKIGKKTPESVENLENHPQLPSQLWQQLLEWEQKF